MRRSLATFSVLLFCCGLFVSQAAATDTSKNLLLLGVGGSGSAIIPSGYQGPGDVIGSAVAYWSCGRAYNKAYALTAGGLCDLVDTATGLATCTLSVNTSGFANLTALSCVGGTVTVVTFCTVTHATGCSITKMYDQTGNGYHETQATLASMPVLTLSELNSLPCANFTSAATSVYMNSSTLTQTQPLTYMAVAERSANFTTGNQILAVGANTLPYMQYRASANSIALSANTQIQSSSGTTDSAFHALIGVIDLNANADSVLVSDGAVVAGAGATGTTAISTQTLQIGHNGSQTSGMFVCEDGMWPGAWTSTQYGNMNTNMHSATNGWNF